MSDSKSKVQCACVRAHVHPSSAAYCHSRICLMNFFAAPRVNPFLRRSSIVSRQIWVRNTHHSHYYGHSYSSQQGPPLTCSRVIPLKAAAYLCSRWDLSQCRKLSSENWLSAMLIVRQLSLRLVMSGEGEGAGESTTEETIDSASLLTGGLVFIPGVLVALVAKGPVAEPRNIVLGDPTGVE